MYIYILLCLKIWDRHVPREPYSSLLIQLLPCTSTESIGNQSLHHFHQEFIILRGKGFPSQRGNTT